MPFNDREAPLFPYKVATHYWDGTQWVEWDGVLKVGDIEIGAVELKNHNTDDRAYITATHLLYVHESDDQVFTEATGAGAIAVAVTPGVAFDLEQITLHLSAVGGAAAGNLTVTCDSGTAAAYDVNLVTQDMVAVQNLVYQPTRPLRFQDGDEIDIAWANPNSVTYGLTIVYSVH